MDAQAAQLLRERTSLALDWLEADLVALKAAAGTTVTVILPALNEEATVATIVRQIRRELMSAASTNLVDELVVLDSGSTDRTAKVAADAGATVIHRDDVLADLPTVPGKGEAMWRGVAATSGDLVVFIDADLRSFPPPTSWDWSDRCSPTLRYNSSKPSTNAPSSATDR